MIVEKDTPWEYYDVGNRTVIVKREDLSCPHPGPSFSKVRGIELLIQSKLEGLMPPTNFGVVDSVHSKAGWGVSYFCHKMGFPCTVFYPVLKAEGPGHIRPYQQKCQNFEAELIPLPATKSSVLYYQARKIFKEKYPEGYLFPNGLKLWETIQSTADVVEKNTPEEFLGETANWLISVSSGTIAAGVAKGLARRGFKGTLILHMGFSRSVKELEDYIRENSAQNIRLRTIDEGYQYKDAVDTPVPFPCNPYYDRKAWKWLVGNVENLSGPVILWNIGQ